MSQKPTFDRIDLATWPRADLFRFFREFERPHYAVTSRLDVTRLMHQTKSSGLSAHRACLYAIGTGVHAVPELRQRFRDDEVRQYDQVLLSITVPTKNGSFGFAEFPFFPDFARFDASTAEAIDLASRAEGLGTADNDREDVIYMSCTPWLDYTALSNPIRNSDDCVPRICWGKFNETASGWDMAMTLEVHHAVVDGVHIAACFDAVQTALNGL